MVAAQILQYVLSGIATGSIYAIVGIGFNVVYNSTGIINFAQGEFLMLGGMIAVSLQGFLPLPLAIAAAIAATGLVGVLVQLVFLSWLKKPEMLRMIVITIGLSILIREAALHVWDEKVHALRFWTGDETSSLSLAGARISPQVIWVLAVSGLMVAALTLFFRFTVTGKAMRACASNTAAARLCGIRASSLVTLSFFIAAAMGALAGCVVSPITQTQYDMGTSLAVKGFTCAVLGGLGSVGAAVAAGVLVGVLESASISVLPLAYKDVVALTIMLAILLLRPQGLFAAIGRRPGLLGARQDSRR
ncbi:MAG TPA: branched-chain amino acid ABC transporter permease [Spirochaetia bacterium]|nr:branched-chain amino acid ABC transporter permease [Spirochaetia bacterium]